LVGTVPVVVVVVAAGSWRRVPAVPAGDLAAAVDGTDHLSSVSWSMRYPKRREDHPRLECWNIGSPIETPWLV